MTDGQGTVSAAAAILYMVIAFLLGGGSVLATVTLLARQILKSPVLIKFLEHLANSASPELLSAVNATAELVDEVTDGVPYEDKPQSGVTDARGTVVDFTPDNDVQAKLSHLRLRSDSEATWRPGIGFYHGS